MFMLCVNFLDASRKRSDEDHAGGATAQLVEQNRQFGPPLVEFPTRSVGQLPKPCDPQSPRLSFVERVTTPELQTPFRLDSQACTSTDSKSTAEDTRQERDSCGWPRGTSWGDQFSVATGYLRLE